MASECERLESHLEKVQRHYLGACSRHPGFARTGSLMVWRSPETIGKLLDETRARNEHGYDTADSILAEELLEQELAISKGDWKSAIYETYDAIAVLLRMADMMEGKMEEKR